MFASAGGASESGGALLRRNLLAALGEKPTARGFSCGTWIGLRFRKLHAPGGLLRRKLLAPGEDFMRIVKHFLLTFFQLSNIIPTQYDAG